MDLSQHNSFEQWLLLGVFFLIFAIYGFTKTAIGQGCRPCYYLFIGLFLIVANTLVLMLLNRTGVNQFELIPLLTLKQASIESSFIVFGYCLIIQGIAMSIKAIFFPSAIKANRHYF